MSNFSGLQFYILWAIHTIFESLPISSSAHMLLLGKYFCWDKNKQHDTCMKPHTYFDKLSMSGFRKVNQNPLALSPSPRETRDKPATVEAQARRSLGEGGWASGTENLLSQEHIKYLMHLPTAIIITIFLAAHSYSLIQNPSIFADRTSVWLVLSNTLISIFWANIATLFFYFLFRKINTLKFPLWLGFLITSALLLSLFWVPQLPFFSTLIIPTRTAIIIGVAQGISLLPGISRLAATLVTAQWCGFDAATAFLFSLIIQLPLILAALAQALYKIIFEKAEVPAWNSCGVLLVACTAVISYALLACVFFCAQHNLLGYFGIYMLVPVIFAYFCF